MATIRPKSAREIEIMRQGGRIVADTLVLLRSHLRPGLTTRSLNDLAADFILSQGAQSSYIEVNFDGVVCISVNDEVVHGIPGARVLRAGDVVSLDIAVKYHGFHADAALTAGVGAISPVAQRLLRTTEESLALGLSLATVGRHLGDISAAIQDHVEAEDFGIIRNLAGHGIGRSMWEAPQILNYRDGSRGPVLPAGAVFTIEPMVSAGDAAVHTLQDGWTIVTDDHRVAAHFEHTVAVTKDGPTILTVPSDRSQLWAAAPPHTVQRLHA
jgi:methionyl aminopeptidase